MYNLSISSLIELRAHTALPCSAMRTLPFLKYSFFYWTLISFRAMLAMKNNILSGLEIVVEALISASGHALTISHEYPAPFRVAGMQLWVSHWSASLRTLLCP